eukprot:TRINITY_DN25105_c0_g1_i1.p1 TRINITY_DN25105_c0_g1~~TRINITY_DN25105_c0_g1_i1.p1  ORF type:complete len:320 (+),score=139.59 TRINITY_DN25105_c0_g1_i1:80-961(+)
MRRAAVLASHLAGAGGTAPAPAAAAAGEEPAVLYAVDGHVATITLNRPRNRNSMTAEVMEGLRDAVERVLRDPDVRCVIIAGTGSSFCAGMDFKDNKVRHKAPDVAGNQGPHEDLYGLYSRFLRVTDIPVPVIGALTGHAVGGGFGLALVCDLRVANANSTYGSNFVRLGLHPGMATTYIVPRLMGLARASEYLLTGRLYSGRQAAELGVANYCEEGSEAVLARARALAEEIAAAAPLAVRWTKQSLLRHTEHNPRPAALYEALLQSRTFESADCREGVAALLQKRKPNFQGR